MSMSRSYQCQIHIHTICITISCPLHIHIICISLQMIDCRPPSIRQWTVRCVCSYLCIYARMYAFMYACMHACMHARTYVRTHIRKQKNTRKTGARQRELLVAGRGQPFRVALEASQGLPAQFQQLVASKPPVRTLEPLASAQPRGFKRDFAVFAGLFALFCRKTQKVGQNS